MSSEEAERHSEQRIQDSLWEGATTRLVRIGSGLLDEIDGCLSSCFGDAGVVVIADENTWEAAGEQVHAGLAAAGRQLCEPLLLDPEGLHAEYSFVQKVQRHLEACKAIPVAVGSGTVNDLTKLGAHLSSRPYAVVATAASMDGYSAFGASITRDGYKQTIACPAPRAVIADLDVLARAPRELNTAGYGDLLAKVPAGADWLLADALGIERLDRDAWDLVQRDLRDWVANPSGVRRGEKGALAELIAGLISTGLAMQRSGSSRPASGADHQFSHLWDMQHHVHAGATPLHGCKVAIGTLASAALYEVVLEKDARDLAAAASGAAARWPRWEDVELEVRRGFPANLAAKVLEQSRTKYLGAAELEARLSRLEDLWPTLRARLRTQLLGVDRLREMLARAGAPQRPEQIGIDRERLRASYALARAIRARYTILDLVCEAGWWERCMDEIFAPGGAWA